MTATGPADERLGRGMLRVGERLPFGTDVDFAERALRFDRWWFVATEPGSCRSPEELRASLERGVIQSQLMLGAGTIASALERLGQLDCDAPPALDACDWWMWCDIERADSQLSSSQTTSAWLQCEGLATYVDLWWNDAPLGQTNNMYLPWYTRVEMEATNRLTLACRAITPRLAPRRPRARWRSRLLESQEWRWHRTTHLGRMPGVGPSIPPVGAWQPITLRADMPIAATQRVVRPSRDGDVSTLHVEVRVASIVPILNATLRCGTEQCAMQMDSGDDGFTLRATLETSVFEAWWPHTHGAPRTYDTCIELSTPTGRQTLSLGAVGFRSVEVVCAEDFAIRLNGCDVFLRGTCWTPSNWADLESIDEQFRADLMLLRDAGINCVRFSGAFTYATEQMLVLCDRFGVAVWQDLMFSVLDYPADDEGFVARCVEETRHVACRSQGHACVLVLCGQSEVEQQASMMGLPTEQVAHGLFLDVLAEVARDTAPHLFYWSGTPHGGALPTQLTEGTAHYFGVGAYERDLTDARRAGVRFATECLAFANLAEPESPSAIVRLDADSASAAWHVHVPRDGGAAWDFADTRDHYAAQLARCDLASLRALSPERYAAFGRAAVANAIERTMQEFRRPGSPTGGALTWLWRDPWRGAGWGMVDRDGRPKSAWYAVRRACRATAIALTDEGLDGVHAHLWNDGPNGIHGRLTARLIAHDGAVVREAGQLILLAGRTAQTVACDALFGAFTDSTLAYRFSSRGSQLDAPHAAVHVAWTQVADDQVVPHTAPTIGWFAGEALIDDATLPVGQPPLFEPVDIVWSVAQTGTPASDTARLAISADRLAYFVRPSGVDCRFDDAYFTLTPGVTRYVTAHATAGKPANDLRVEALNASTSWHGTVTETLAAERSDRQTSPS